MSNTAQKQKATRGLGRGLSALLDDATATSLESGKAEEKLPIDALQPSTVQPRRVFDDESLKSLSDSIRSQGVLQPLLVRQLTDGKYEIVGGERRWRAARLAGLNQVPVIIRDLDDGKALEVAIVENVQRSDLNPIDEAAGYQRLVDDFQYTHDDIGRVTGKSRSHITNLLRLLALPAKLKECVSKSLLTMGHARALLGIVEDEALQIRAANKVITNGLSVRETEDLVRNLTAPSGSRRGRRTTDPQTSALEKMMQKSIGLRVSIKRKEDKGGSVRIFFDTQEDLSKLLHQVGAEDGVKSETKQVA